ncbi:MAG: hypothetical protein XD63_1208 [Thermoanaerobacterales bacterium 50_218]|nr:MAG: hypothetical protein XD63_1208 [Thermoanaerobacterales bacterium 50_218]HAA90241.1 hypothetical protein [Peptococcaceae bacterium]
MTNSKTFSWKLFLLCLLVIVAGGIVAAVTTGWIDLGRLGESFPFLAKWVSSENVKEDASLEEENKKLKAKIAKLEKEVKELRAQKEMLQQLQKNLEESKAAEEERLAEEQRRKERYRDLATYYAEMEPESAVAILDNLDPGMVAEILQAMDPEQAGAILEAMDPGRAAELLKLMVSKAET